MKYGYFADNELPTAHNPDYDTNSKGYRCPEFDPLPDGGKNVVALGCSHTFGEGLDRSDVWLSRFEKKIGNKNLRFWNLAQPGASANKCVRILYGTEKLLFPKIIIVCWPVYTRRERLDHYPMSLTSDNPLLKNENDYTDHHNFLQCVFHVEKFAEHNRASTFHCFANDVYPLADVQIFSKTTLKKCWPEYDTHHLPDAKKELINTPSVASDGLHYGIEHHETFAKLLAHAWQRKLS